MFTPNRRQVLGATLAAGVAAVSAGAPPDRVALLQAIRTASDALLRRCRSRLGKDPAAGLARADGYTYTVDLAQLMLAFAAAGDPNAYAALRDFATNSFLVDYDPDFVAAVARRHAEAHGQNLKDLADKSYALVNRAVAPSGLLYDLVQPEVATLVPGLDRAVFSPNDVIQISNSCTVAATVAEGLPQVTRGVLDFAARRKDQLRLYYYGRNGDAVKADVLPGVNEYSGLARLAALLGDRDTAHDFASRALPAWEALAKGDSSDAYAATESLLAIQAVLRLDGK